MIPQVSDASKARIKHVSKFGLAGLMNTVLDYILFISLTKLFSIPLEQVWMAKFASGAVAMANSFYLNRRWVFEGHTRKMHDQAWRFVAVTVVGVFVIQAGLVQLFSTVISGPGVLSYEVMSQLGLTEALPSLLTLEFTIKTTAFVLATVVSMAWNFLMYKRVVFTRE